jgi:hypothetical protein
MIRRSPWTLQPPWPGEKPVKDLPTANAPKNLDRTDDQPGRKIALGGIAMRACHRHRGIDVDSSALLRRTTSDLLSLPAEEYFFRVGLPDT